MSSNPFELSKRERQIVEVVYRLGEASVKDVLQQIPDPPSYSAVRATLRLLSERNVLKFRQDGKKYLYRPALPRERARKSALTNVLTNFFGGEPLEAMAALLDVPTKQLSAADIKRMKKIIRDAQAENEK